MKKTIPTKNYVMLLISIVVTIIVVFYARSWYITTKEYATQKSVMTTVINEINPNEITNYALENPKFILYCSSGQNTNIKSFENALKKYIEQTTLNTNILYLNMDNIDINKLQTQLQSYSKQKIELNDNPVMYIFSDGKIKYVLYNINNMSIKRINKKLIKYEMIDSD